MLIVEASPDSGELWADVCAMARQLAQENSLTNPSTELATLCEGTLPAGLLLLVACEGESAAGFVAVVCGAERNFEIAALFVEPGYRQSVACLDLLDYAMRFQQHARQWVAHLAESNIYPGGITEARLFGFEPAGQRRWKLDNGPMLDAFVSKSYRKCRKHGWGDWTVVLFNDEITPMDVVVESLVRTFDLNPVAASEAMLLVHLLGSAPVWRYRKEATAHDVASKLRLAFRERGFATTVDVVRDFPEVCGPILPALHQALRGEAAY